MRTSIHCLILLGSMSVLSGCASLSENDCRAADWESIGYRDGSQGHNAGRLANHSAACAEYGIKTDRELYEQGRLRGLELFCTGSNALRLGRQGHSYSGVCPLSLEPQFSRGYQLGRQMHDLDVHMQQLRAEIQTVQAQIKRQDPPVTDADRDALLYRLGHLEREYGRSESDLRQLEAQALNF